MKTPRPVKARGVEFPKWRGGVRLHGALRVAGFSARRIKPRTPISLRAVHWNCNGIPSSSTRITATHRLCASHSPTALLQGGGGEGIILKCEAPRPELGRSAAGQKELDAPEGLAVVVATGGTHYMRFPFLKSTSCRAERFSFSEDFFEIGRLRFEVVPMKKARQGLIPWSG